MSSPAPSSTPQPSPSSTKSSGSQDWFASHLYITIPLMIIVFVILFGAIYIYASLTSSMYTGGRRGLNILASLKKLKW